MAELSLKQVHKSFGGVDVIRGVDLEIAHGELVVFVGPSGCGKSTMLRMISGLEDVTSGEIRIDGRDITHTPPSKREIAMVFQSYALFPHMSVADNIGFGLKLAGLARAEIAARVKTVAATLQIEPLLQRLPRELSGGQRQRVAIGRAIIRNPRIFLLDEPLSNLDAALRVQMRLELARLHARLGATMIYVTHDQTEAMTLADRIVVFNGGKVEQIGAPMELYERPANIFVARFIGAPAMNLLPASLYPGGQAPRRPGMMSFGVRPEHLQFARAGEGLLRGRVEIVERLGAETLYYVSLGPDLPTVTVRANAGDAVARGQEIALEFTPACIHPFDSEGLRSD